MATAATYILQINDGDKQDVILLATKLLNERLSMVRRQKCSDMNETDTAPTMYDVEKTHVCFMSAHFKPFVSSVYQYQLVRPQEGNIVFGSTFNFSIPEFGDFFTDMVMRINLSQTSATSPLDQVFYCPFPGHRIVSNVSWRVNGIVLDTYTTDVMNYHYNFFIGSSNQVAWARMMGQEVPHQGYLTQNPGVDAYRELKFLCDGPQTPKNVQPAIDLWIPMLFWFNQDPRLSILSQSIPYGQRFIRITTPTVDLLVGSINNGGGGGFIPPVMNDITLYVNNIFVNPEIHNLFTARATFSLIRVHRIQYYELSNANGSLLLDQIKWPVETMYFGVRPLANLANLTRWNIYANVATQIVRMPVRVPIAVPPFEQLAFADATFQIATPVLNTASLTLFDNVLYGAFPVSFYRDYIPYNYGNNLVVPPNDVGQYMMTFNLYPGAYQPSGYINFSRTRQIYLGYNAPTINLANPCQFSLVAIALNFAKIEIGSMTLRFAT